MIDDSDDLHGSGEQGDREKGGGIIGESLRKALVTGISAVFMTEEGIRGALSDLRLPKEAMAYLLQQTANTRRELTRVVADELKSALRNADLTGVLKKALAGMRVEVKAEIRFVDEAGHTEVTTREVTASSVDEPKKRKRKG